ncbi:MAG: cell division protein FtsW [Candidatus Berkelbacteria bacterium Licking1014_7]|uniref:Probable peptidoglycan glycosyltransferase FtsW n=1 Tax=Candidatus Berkelbacteria bacterium Licking1014_7 TaxID=2017147 RepID=A0A554LK64_9BACT|nr:MAG: cell division protein FtsW [Candidatus Berkelbacteria bacterium Licking1014_7]
MSFEICYIMSLNRFRPQQGKKGDYWILLLALLLSLIGLAMISSASVVISYDRYGYNTYFLTKQAISLGLGIVVMMVLGAINYKVWEKYSVYLLGIGLLGLVLVFIPGLGQKIAGAQRWIEVGPFSLQPSEFMKIIYIVYAGAWLASKKNQIRHFLSGVAPFILILGVLILLIMKQPALSTVLVITACAAVMVFVAGASKIHLFFAGGFGLMFFWALIKSANYRMQRVLTFLHPLSDPLGAGYQISQSFLAIGSGGWWGLGFGQSRQKYLYLPQPHIDSIFAIIVEELGFLRSLVIVLIIATLIYKGFTIALKCPDPFGRIVATGISFWIAFQTLVNIGATTGILPLTGIPLPFISYGGSALVALLAGVGILYNISKYSE